MRNSDSSVILDASAFYAGIPFSGSSRFYTTTKVFDEIKHIRKSFAVLETLLDAGNLRLKDPSADYLRDAKKLARQSGDLVKMSEADLSIVALALEFKALDPLIITDDYAIANVAKPAGIKVSFVMSKGVAKVGRWVRYCSACGVVYGFNTRNCRVCGNKLRAKLKSSQKH